MKILFPVIIISAVVFMYVLIRKNKNKSCKIPSINNVQKFIFGDEHKAILHQFKGYESKHFSADALQSSTNIEFAKVYIILSDLVEHDILIQSNTDSVRGNWLYMLSDNGKKYVHEHT